MSSSELPTFIPALIKGHASGADYLLYTDRDGSWEPSGEQTARLLDRNVGLGGSALLRAVPARLMGCDSTAEWFMDARGPDGTRLAADGDDLRVFAAYLQHTDLLTIPEDGSLAVATHTGVRHVRRDGTDFTVDMGGWSFPGGEDALADGFDVSVIAEGLTDQRPGLRVTLAAEHVVVALQDQETLDLVGVDAAADVDPRPQAPVQIEFVVPLGEQETAQSAREGLIRMRARGSNEQRHPRGESACAAAIAVREWFGDGAPRRWRVQTPGGSVDVLTGTDRVELCGPVELVGTVTLLP